MQTNGKTVQYLLILTICLSRLHIGYSQCDGVALVLQSHLFTTIYVQSPNYSTGQYSQNLTCTWRIDSSVNSSQFMYTFHHKRMVNTDDVIKIYEGVDATGTPRHDTTNNLSQDSTITRVTTSDSLFIQFITDDDPSNNGNGFDLYLLESIDSSGAACTTTEQLQAQSTLQYITSPNFPQKYPVSVDCTWNVSSAEGTDVEVSVIFIDVEVQSSTQCYDFLTVGDSTELCANREWNTGLTFIFNESLLINFISDNQEVKQGFALSYIEKRNNITDTTESDTTTPVFTSTSAFITSPELTDITSPLEQTSNVQTVISTDARLFSSTSTATALASHSTTDDLTNSIRTTAINPTESTIKSTMTTSSEPYESTSIITESTSKSTTEQTSTEVSNSSTVKTESEATTQTFIIHDSTTISQQETPIETTETSEHVTSSITSHMTTGTTGNVATPVSYEETLPPAAVGAIIAGAIVGVAGVGIAMGAVVFLLFIKCTGDKHDKYGSHSNQNQGTNEIPRWIKMLDTMKKQRYNPTFLDF